MSEIMAISLLVTSIIGLVVLTTHCVIITINLNKVLKLLKKCNNKKRINKIINLLEECDERGQFTSPRQKTKYSGATASSSEKQFVKTKEVDELPPEVIAPSLKNPPRPTGGFGSRVDKDKRDS
jgi:hypothetical protein